MQVMHVYLNGYFYLEFKTEMMEHEVKISNDIYPSCECTVVTD